MNWLAAIGELILGFIIGTLALWMCSFTVKTQRANMKTAAIYNGVMTVLGGVLVVIGVVSLYTESDFVGGIFGVFTVLMLIASFWLLMRMYDLSFLATLWLFVAMCAVDALVEKLIEIVT